MLLAFAGWSGPLLLATSLVVSSLPCHCQVTSSARSLAKSLVHFLKWARSTFELRGLLLNCPKREHGKQNTWRAVHMDLLSSAVFKTAKIAKKAKQKQNFGNFQDLTQ